MNFFKAFGLFASALIFVLSAVFLSSLISKWQLGEQKTTPPLATRLIVDCPNDFSSYEKVTKRLKLVENIPSFGNPDGSFTGKTVSIKRTGLKSQVACGYLFYRVSVGDKPIEQKYANLYMGAVDSRGGVQSGGHVLPDKNVEIVNRNTNGKTEILLPLNSITYDGTERKNIKQANWISLLNVSDQIDFQVALNTAEQSGKIDLVEIAYKCWNPETGEETQDCSLDLVK